MTDLFVTNYNFKQNIPTVKNTNVNKTVNNYNTKQQVSSQPDRFVSNNVLPATNDISDKAMALGAIGVLSLGALAYILSRGKVKSSLTDEAMGKLNSLAANGKIDKTYLDIFKDAHTLNGKTFIQDVYNRLTKAMGYDKYKPQLVILDSYSSSRAGSNSISISPKAFSTKEQQVGAIRHELEHFRQNELVYRSFGREAYINAKIEPSITVIKLSDEKCIKRFGKRFKDLSTSELEAYRAKVRISVESKLQILEDLLKERGAISSTSAEYAEAEKYLHAMKEYVTPTAIWGEKPSVYARLKTEAPEQFKLAQDILRKYNNNALEQGAVREETKIKDMYKLFRETISNN